MKKLQQSVATVLEGEWLTLAETVQTLNKSQSTVERLVGSGALQSKLVRRERRKPERLYSAGDVKRLARNDRINPTSRTIAIAKAPVETRLAIQPDAISAVRELMTEWKNAPRSIALDVKLWLTLEEAVAYSGLSVAAILAGIAEEKIISGNLGRHGRRVVQRVSLEAYAG